MTSLCHSLESIMSYFRDVKPFKDNNDASFIYGKLKSFKMIYCLYFLNDMLHRRSLHSKTFQCKFINVSSIESIVRAEITQIIMLFIDESVRRKVCKFNENSAYFVIPDNGRERGYLKRLSSQITGNWYYGVQMIRDKTGHDFEKALHFQNEYARAMIDALEEIFDDTGVISAFKILNPHNMPSKLMGLATWVSQI